MPKATAPKTAILPEEVRHYVLLAKGHYLIERNGFLTAARQIYWTLHYTYSDEGLLRDIIALNQMVLKVPEVQPLEETVECWAHLWRGMGSVIQAARAEQPTNQLVLELLIQSLLVPVARWRLPEFTSLGYPNCTGLIPTDTKLIEKMEAQAYVGNSV